MVTEHITTNICFSVRSAVSIRNHHLQECIRNHHLQFLYLRFFTISPSERHLCSFHLLERSSLPRFPQHGGFYILHTHIHTHSIHPSQLFLLDDFFQQSIPSKGQSSYNLLVIGIFLLQILSFLSILHWYTQVLIYKVLFPNSFVPKCFLSTICLLPKLFIFITLSRLISPSLLINLISIQPNRVITVTLPEAHQHGIEQHSSGSQMLL